jgi:hypothetical protein
MSDGFMMERIVMEQAAVQKKRPALYQEVENEKERAYRQQNRATIDAATRRAGETAYKTGRASFAGEFFAKAVKLGGDRVTDDAAPHRSQLITHPDRDIEAIEPEKNSSADKHGIAQNCEQA